MAEKNAADARRTATLLEARGFAVTVEAGVLDRILCRATTADLLVLDVMLDGTDAFEILRALAARRLDPPLLLVTDRFADYLDVARSLAEGLGFSCIDGLRKPFDPAAFVAAVERLACIAGSPGGVLDEGAGKSA